MVYSASRDGGVGVWNRDKDEFTLLPKFAQLARSDIFCVCASDLYVAAGRENGSILVWIVVATADANQQQVVVHQPHIFINNEPCVPVRAVKFNDPGTIFVSGNDNGKLEIRRVVTSPPRSAFTVQMPSSSPWVLLHVVMPHAMHISSIAFLPSSPVVAPAAMDEYVVSGSWDGDLVCTNAITGELVAPGRIQAHSNWVTSVVICSSLDGMVLSSSTDGSIAAFDLLGELLNRLEHAHGGANVWCLHTRDIILASCGGDGNVRIWSLSSLFVPLAVIPVGDDDGAGAQASGVYAVCLTESMLVAVGADRMIRVWG
jgi:WD40 repeat protein